MIRYIDEHKDRFGVEGICRVLGEQLECGFLIASGYWAAKRREPAARTLSYRQLVPVLERLHAANYGVYGVRNMWWLLHREGHRVGRDRVAQLMCRAGLRGVVAAARSSPGPMIVISAPTIWCNVDSPRRRRTDCGWPT